MSAEFSTTPAVTLADLETAAERLWGAERQAALDGPLRRVAGALATVASFPLPSDMEPFPTGPEPPQTRTGT